MARLREHHATDEIALVEAAYHLDGTETEWLERVVTAATHHLDYGMGVSALTVHVGQSLQVRHSTCEGGRSGLPEAIVQMTRDGAPRMMVQAFTAGPCTTMSMAVGTDAMEANPASAGLYSLGIFDALGVLGIDSSGYGVVLASFLPKVTRLSRRKVARWSRMSSHLSAGFRARRGLAAAASATAGFDPIEGCEAILTPDGRLEHAEGPAQRARSVLARAVFDIDRARGPLRDDDPDAAIAAWEALVAGRWSLLEHFDTDGKRFLVARKNDADVARVAGLSLRERQVLAARARALPIKIIAYDLGLSMATVSKALRSGMAKLGLASEAELAALFFPGASGAIPPPEQE